MNKFSKRKSEPTGYEEFFESRNKIMQPAGEFQDLFKRMEQKNSKKPNGNPSSAPKIGKPDGSLCLSFIRKEKPADERAHETQTQSGHSGI